MTQLFYLNDLPCHQVVGDRLFHGFYSKEVCSLLPSLATLWKQTSGLFRVHTFTILLQKLRKIWFLWHSNCGMSCLSMFFSLLQISLEDTTYTQYTNNRQTLSPKSCINLYKTVHLFGGYWASDHYQMLVMFILVLFFTKLSFRNPSRILSILFEI